MSLTKSIVHETSVNVPHWRITEVVIQPVQRGISVEVSGWVSLAAFQAGAQPIARKAISLSGTNMLDALQAVSAVAAAKTLLAKLEEMVKARREELADATQDSADVL
jgi:hypothetical protein